MDDRNIAGFFVGVIAVAIVIFLMFIAAQKSQQYIAEDCIRMGSFVVGDTVYNCEAR